MKDLIDTRRIGLMGFSAGGLATVLAAADDPRAALWVGLDPGGTLGDRETGAKAALPIWIQFMKNAPVTGSPPYFDLPDNVIKVHMNPQTGMLADEGAINAVDALFIEGTEPKE